MWFLLAHIQSPQQSCPLLPSLSLMGFPPCTFTGLFSLQNARQGQAVWEGESINIYRACVVFGSGRSQKVVAEPSVLRNKCVGNIASVVRQFGKLKNHLCLIVTSMSLLFFSPMLCCNQKLDHLGLQEEELQWKWLSEDNFKILLIDWSFDRSVSQSIDL